MRHWMTALAAALVLLGGFSAPAAGAEADDLASEIQTLLPKDAIPAIDFPVYVSVKEAEEFMFSGEMVVGVDIGGDRRAYSIPFLSRHEIVNDVIGGRKVAVTW